MDYLGYYFNNLVSETNIKGEKVMDAKDILIRAIKTFFQAFLAAVAAGLVNVVNWSTFKALVVSALAMAVSAVWNIVVAGVKG